MLEKSAKRWIRRLLAGDIGKPYIGVGELAQKVYVNRRNPLGKIIPYFEGTAKDRLAEFKSSNISPSVTRRRVGDYGRFALKADVETYLDNARNSEYGKHLINKAQKLTQHTKNRKRNINELATKKTLSLPFGNHRIYDTPILKQYYTPNAYGITAHLANAEQSELANKLAREAFGKNKNYVQLERPITSFISTPFDTIAVGGPGIKYTPEEVKFMRNASTSDEARNLAETMLYESTANPLSQDRFRLRRVLVPETKANREYFKVGDDVAGIDTADLVPTMRDTVFKGSPRIRNITIDEDTVNGVGQYFSKLIDIGSTNPKYQRMQYMLSGLVNNIRSGKIDVKKYIAPDRWYSPNAVIAGDYAGTRKVIPVPIDAYKKLLQEYRAHSRITDPTENALEELTNYWDRTSRLTAKADKQLSKNLSRIPDWLVNTNKTYIRM